MGLCAVLVDDDFIRCLFDIIEDLSYDVTDPYHYPVIRVLVSTLFGLILVGMGLTNSTAGSERAIHDLGPRSGGWPAHWSIDQQGYQGPIHVWWDVQDIRREHHSSYQP